jgi:hypothetical protein
MAAGEGKTCHAHNMKDLGIDRLGAEARYALMQGIWQGK